MKTGIKIRVYDIALIAVMSAMLEACKIALNAIPNVELVSFLLVIYALRFGWKRSVAAALIFTALEILTWGFQLWVIFYLYAWPLLVIIAYKFRKHDSALFFAVVSGIYGLCFGALSSLIYVAVGDFGLAISWWVAGLSYDLIHGASNFCIMLILYKPVLAALNKIERLP